MVMRYAITPKGLKKLIKTVINPPNPLAIKFDMIYIHTISHQVLIKSLLSLLSDTITYITNIPNMIIMGGMTVTKTRSNQKYIV